MNDGGPAFPAWTGKITEENYGMYLRDYFATQAMTGLFGDQDLYKTAGKHACSAWVVIAATAYAVADAMLAERNKPHAPK
jgi:hypothetical protein